MRSYWSKKNKSEMAFCMPCNYDDVPNYKIVLQDQKRRNMIVRLVMRNFRTQEEAQDRLDKIARAKGWPLAFETR